MKHQFFISSTYKDLIEERQIAINVIMKMGHIPAGMELFTALLKADFSSLIRDNNNYRWAGIYIRSLPCRDWRKYILNGSLLKFSVIATKNVKCMWFEIKSDQVEICS